MFLNCIIVILCLVTDQSVAYEVISNKTDCDPNRVYKKDEITCICSKEGRWPHQNCSVFKTTENTSRICEPDTYVTVDCNVCRCSKTGNIDKEFCTNHNCEGYDHIKIIRRSNERIKCEPNHWYALTDCRLCYCINKNNLLCNSGIANPKKVPLNTYNLTDCGSNLLRDINKLLTTKNPLGSKRTSKKEKQDTIASKEYGNQHVKTTPTMKIATDDIFSIFFNRESNKDMQELSENSDDNDVDSNDEDIQEPAVAELPEDKPIARLAANTVIPFENDEDDSTNYSIDSERNNSDELGHNKQESEEFGKSSEGNNDLLESNKQTPKKIERSDKTVINLNIPGILEKMFNLRRSMVSIDNANCVRGSTVTVECNTCFCLKNGKMLCTLKKCN